MGLTDLAIRRPVATAMVYLIVVSLGAVAFLYLPVDLLPRIEFPRLSVTVDYPNVGPEEMESIVTDPLDTNLDANTFAWTEVGFGDVLLSVPPRTQHFRTTVPMTQNGRTFDVEIELSLNSQTGRLRAVFESIDPATEVVQGELARRGSQQPPPAGHLHAKPGQAGNHDDSKRPDLRRHCPES